MDKKKKNILIGGLLAIVLLLAVGYAAFATNLNINGTSSIDSRWDVHIKDNGVSVKSSNMATNVNAQKDSQLTASFQCELTDPGVSTISYDIIVENSGTFGAKLSSITLTGTTAYIDATTEGIEVGDVIAANGGTDTLTVTVSYKNVSTVPTGEDATANITVTLNYIQDDGASSGGSEQASSLTIDQTFVPQYYEYRTYSSNGYVMYSNSYDTSTWTQDPTTLAADHNYYLGHDVNITSGTTGTITANYICFVSNNTQYCLKTKDAASNVYYNQNIALLTPLKEAGTITCTKFPPNDTYADCSSSSLGYMSWDNYGAVFIGASSSAYCYGNGSGATCIGQ